MRLSTKGCCSAVAWLALCAPAFGQGDDDLAKQCLYRGFALGTQGHAACMRTIASGITESELRDACVSVMLTRPSSNGTSAALENGYRCNADPFAHLRPVDKPMNCSVARDVFGRIQGMTCS